MITLRSPGMPTEEDLPALPAGSITSLVDALIAEDATRLASTDATLIQYASTPPRPPYRAARTWLAAAAAVVAVALVTTAISGTDEATTPPATRGGTGPANFPCGGELTSATASLPGANYISGPEYTMEVGIAGDTFCFRRYATSAAPGVTRSFDAAAPVPFFAVGETENFGVFESGATVPAQSFRVAYAYGAVAAQVDRVQFVPTVATDSTVDFGSFYAVADVKAFVVPFRGSGTLNFYAGAELVDAKPVDASGTAPAGPGNSGAAAAPFAFVAADGIADYSYAPGQRAHLEDISGPSVTDPTTTLRLDDYPDTAIVLTTWASWCDPCRSQASDLTTTSEKYQDRGVQFIGLDMQDTRQLASDFITDLEVPFPSIFDPSANVLQQAIPGLPTVTLPVTVILDRHHNLAQVYLRTVTGAELARALDALAAE